MSSEVRMSREAQDYVKTLSVGDKKLDSYMNHVVFKRTTYDVMDNKSAVSIMVERSRSNGKLVVRYQTRDGNAHSGENYIGGAGTLTFKHGEKVASISIPLRDTDFEEGVTVKTFYVRLLEGAILRGKTRRLYTLRGAFEAEVRIWDNGEPVVEEHEITNNLEEIAKYAGERARGRNIGEEVTMTLRERGYLCWYYGETPINNNSSIMTIYDVLGLVMILITAVVTPYQLAFLTVKISWSSTSFLFWMDRVVDVYFLFDIFINFLRPVTDHQRGVDVIHLTEIRNQYLKGWFAIDVISTVPLDIIALFVNGLPVSLKAVRLLRLLRLMKLARMLRATRTLQQWQNRLNVTYTKVELLKIFVIICFCAHWMACCWGLMANADWLTEGESITWFDLLVLDSKDPELVDDPYGQYIMSIYFAVMTLTTVGYGDIHPTNGTEHVVCIFFMLVGGVTWAYLIGILTSIVTNLDRQGTTFKQVMDELNYMIEDIGLPDELASRVRSYWRAVQHLTRLKTYESLKALMSPQLQGELAFYSGSERYQSVYYLSSLGEEVLIMLASHCSMNKRLYAPGEKIYERQTLCIVINNGQVGSAGKILGLNDSWGHDFILENPVLRHDTLALTLTYSEVETVTIDKLNAVLNVFQSEKKLVGRARARFALLRGLPRLARFLKTVEINTAPSELRREGLRLLEELSQGDEEREMMLLEKAAVFVPRSYFGKDPYKGLKVGDDKKRVPSGSFDDTEEGDPPLLRRRKSTLMKELGLSGNASMDRAISQGSSAVAAVAAAAAANAAKTDDVMEQLRADLGIQRVELQVLKENVSFQSRRMTELANNLSELREATAMVLSAQVKILEAVTTSNHSPPSSNGSPRRVRRSRSPPPSADPTRASVSMPRLRNLPDVKAPPGSARARQKTLSNEQGSSL
mmetsp:Transcript_6484/g.7871  ORF Transcript_6484/g.7871 Transcript_6484/m.7871 type:complete len:918 (-) Transcript_6484:222-2975(-)